MRETMLWLIQRISGAILFIGLLMHFYLMHFMGTEQLSYELITARLNDPLWIVFNIVFLISAIYHGFNGLWGIALEYIKGRRAQRLAGFTITATSITLTGIGIYILTLG